MRTGAVYRVTHTESGRVYIGRTVNAPRDRWLAHLRAARKGSIGRFHRALRKYGPEAFVFEVVADSIPLDELNNAERAAIAAAGCETYNLTAGGDGCLSPSAETRARLAISKRRVLARPEVREKLRRATAAQWADPEARAARIAAQMAAFSTNEAKARRGETTRAAWADPEARAARIAAQRAGWTEEAKARHAASLSRSWADVATRAARTEGVRAAQRARALVRRWVHSDYGEFVGAAWALAEAFPGQGLGTGALAGVATGMRPHYKGWRVAAPGG